MATPLYAFEKRWDIKDPIIRFFKKVEFLDNGCWGWMGKLEPNGYSRFSIREARTSGHVYSYQTFVGEIPEGYHIDHLCRNRGCVNPEHLEAVTPQENWRRGVLSEVSTARHAAARKPFCNRGHSLTDPENVIHRKGPHGRWKGVRCKTCQRYDEAQFRLRRKEQKNAG